mmetsp:Transcript_5537/g.12038  ORF Transcript_5537/g.12038 Transcript_5537/m.12038 type:complete len:269 (-) Transcript_5537:56-862(-)
MAREIPGAIPSPCNLDARAVSIFRRRFAHSTMDSSSRRRRRMGSGSRKPTLSRAIFVPSEIQSMGDDIDRATDASSSSISTSGARTVALMASAAAIVAANSSLRGREVSSSFTVRDRFSKLPHRMTMENASPANPPVYQPFCAKAGSDPSAAHIFPEPLPSLPWTSTSSCFDSAFRSDAALRFRMRGTRDGDTSTTTAVGRTASIRRRASSADSDPMCTVPRMYALGRGWTSSPLADASRSCGGSAVWRLLFRDRAWPIAMLKMKRSA